MIVLRLIQFQSADVADTATAAASATAANTAGDAGDAGDADGFISRIENVASSHNVQRQRFGR